MKYAINLVLLLFIILTSVIHCQEIRSGTSIARPYTLEEQFIPTGVYSLESFSQSITDDDEFFSMVYTHGTIVLFSYYDNTDFHVENSSGSTIYDGILDESEHKFLSVSNGFYSVTANKRYSVLIGDPFEDGTCGYFAINQYGSAISCTLYTLCPNPMSWPAHDRTRNILFAYHDSTHVIIYEVGGTFSWSGTLNAGEYQEWDEELGMKYLAIYADKPVSFQHHNDIGYFVPDTSGRWAGNCFYAYSGGIEDWHSEDYNECWLIISLEDNNRINIRTYDGTPIFTGTLNKGEYQYFSSGGFPRLFQKYIICETSKKSQLVSVPMVESYAHLLFIPSTDGNPGGVSFYVPCCGDSRIIIFGRSDATHVDIITPHGSVDNYLVNSGEFLNYSCETSGEGAGIYEVHTSDTVIVLEYSVSAAGSEFIPLFFTFSIPPPCSIQVTASADDSILHAGDSTFLHADIVWENPPVNFEWWSNPAGFSSDQQNPNTGPIVEDTWFIVRAIDSRGCEDLDSVLITIFKSKCDAHPDPFTPNGDEINSMAIFDYPGKGIDDANIKILIFDLKNRLVRTLEGGVYMWDGKDESGNDMPKGVYLYIIKNGSNIICHGTIHLAR